MALSHHGAEYQPRCGDNDRQKLATQEVVGGKAHQGDRPDERQLVDKDRRRAPCKTVTHGDPDHGRQHQVKELQLLLVGVAEHQQQGGAKSGEKDPEIDHFGAERDFAPPFPCAPPGQKRWKQADDAGQIADERVPDSGAAEVRGQSAERDDRVHVCDRDRESAGGRCRQERRNGPDANLTAGQKRNAAKQRGGSGVPRGHDRRAGQRRQTASREMLDDVARDELGGENRRRKQESLADQQGETQGRGGFHGV